MRKVIRWAFVSVSLLVAIAALVVWGLFHAARQEPKFYQEALKIEPARQAEVGDQFEHEVLELRNDARTTGEWQAEFTAEEINAWLAVELPEKFPDALPPELENPRVAIEDGVIRVAARFSKDSYTSVISFALDVKLTPEPNTLAIRIHSVRAGSLPVPLTTWLEKVQTQLQASKLNVHWSQTDGDPVAIVEIPSKHPDKPKQRLLLDSLAVESGSLKFAGRTGTAENLGLSPTESSSVVHRPGANHSTPNETSQR